MSAHMPGFQTFFFFLGFSYYFVMAKLATRHLRVKSDLPISLGDVVSLAVERLLLSMGLPSLDSANTLNELQ